MIEFARPEFLYALPAAAMPWIIDLLNRRRFRRVRWAAMDYVMQAAQRRRRRIRLQHVLLLLLRTLAVLLVVLLFAQPRVARGLPRLGGAGTRIALVLDDSASMAQRVPEGTVFDRAKDYARSIAERAASSGADLSVYTPGQSEPERPCAAAFDMAWLASLGARAGAARYYVVTDLRAADWGTDQLAPAARRALAALQQYGPVVLVDVGADPGPNAGITDVLGAGRFTYVGATASLRPVVQNDGPGELPAGTLSLSADGGALPAVAAPSVPPGGRVEVPAQVFLDSPGGHYVQVALGGSDSFPPDDVRYYALDAADQVPVLVVEGAAGSAFYLRTALQPVPGARSGLRPDVVSAGAELPADLSAYAAVFLCDVSSPALWRDTLVRYVRGGGRLVAFLGGRADADAWDRSVFAADGGLPVCRVAGSARPGKQAPARISGMDFSDPLLRPFADWQAPFAAPLIWEYWQLDALPGARALLRLDDPAASPALLVAHEGTGLVAVFPFGADDAWTDWPRSDLGRVGYLSLMQWLVESGGQAGPALNIEAGAGVRHRLDPALYRSVASLVPPSAGQPAEPVPLRALPQEGADGLYFVSGPLRQAGVYELRLERTDGGRRSVCFAVNVAAAERLLARARPDVVLTAATSPGRLGIVHYAGTSTYQPAASAPWWRAVAALALVVLAVEGLLAYLFSNPPGVRR